MIWNPWAVPALLAGVTLAAAAALIYQAGSTRRINRGAQVLILCSIAVTCFYGARPFSSDPVTAMQWTSVAVLAALALPAIVVRFLHTFRTPLARPAGPASQIVLSVYALAMATWWLADRSLLLDGMVRTDIESWHIEPTPMLLLAVAGPLVLVCIHAILVTAIPGSAADSEASSRAAVAFAAAGVMFLVHAALSGSRPESWLGSPLHAVLTTVGALAVAFAVARTTAFTEEGLGRRVARRALTDSLTALVLATVFFATGEALERLIPLKGTTLTILTATAITLTMRPLQARAEAIADRIIPYPDEGQGGWKSYRAAAETAWSDGALQYRDRVLLDGLRRQTGLDERTARRLEGEARRMVKARAAGPGISKT